MIETFKKIWCFSDKEQSNIIKSVVLNFFGAIFHMLQIGAIFLAIKGIVEDSANKHTILLCLGMIVTSIVGKIMLQYFSQLQQTHAGYFMTAHKRISIGQKIKRIPMGFFNQSSLGNLTGICTTVLTDVEIQLRWCLSEHSADLLLLLYS